jgi:5-methylcytosine-specific restriction endonuclease McrA
MDISNKSGIVPHFDHKKSLGEGGKNILSNYQALCPNCHSIKTREDRHNQAKKKEKEKRVDPLKDVFAAPRIFKPKKNPFKL